MNQHILALVLGSAALAATTAADAGVQVIVNPFGWIAPPVVYAPAPFYAAPPVVYGGGGYWGGHRDRHPRGHGRHR